MRKRLALALTFIAGAMLLTVAKAETTITIARELDAERYDPQRSVGRPLAEVLFMVADTLVALDYDQKTVVPNLAERWTVSADGLTYEFRLKPGITFCDGKPLNAQSVAASYKRWLDPATKAVNLERAGDVAEIKAIDDLTLSYKLKRPYSELLLQMTQPYHLIIDAAQAEKLGLDFGVQAFNGSGPFCFESWRPRDRVVLKRNPAYAWGPPIYTSANAQVDRVEWRIVPEEGTRVASVMSGQIDITQDIPSWARLDIKPGGKVSMVRADPSFLTRYIGMKNDHEILRDRAVREAINLVVDQKDLNEALNFAFDEPASSMIAPGASDRINDLNESLYGLDIPKASKLLTDAGWIGQGNAVRQKTGKPLTLQFCGFNSVKTKQVSEAVQSDLRKVGIDMKVSLFDATIAFSKIASPECAMYYLGQSYISSLDILSMYFHSKNRPQPNRFEFHDAQVDGWLDRATRSVNPAERAALLANVQRQIHQEFVAIPLFHEHTYLASSARLKSLRAHMMFGSAIYKGLDIAVR